MEQESITKTATILAKHELVKLQGNFAAGNVMIKFDVNTYVETMKAPHIRKPPVVKDNVQNLWKDILQTRHGNPEHAVIPEGEVHVLLDGG